MISTLHGNLDVLVTPADGLQVNMRDRAEICTLRGQVLGHQVNARLMLDLNTGEFLLLNPDNFIGAFRLGDLVVSQVMAAVHRAQMERHDQEGGHVAQTH